MKLIEKAIVKVAEVSAKQAVSASSPWFCYQTKEPEAARKKFVKKEK